jgi:hypothetical protein
MMLNNFAASNYQLVELKVPANTTSTRVYFQDQPNLRNKIIEKVEFYDSFLLPNAPSGVANNLSQPTSFITFADGTGNEFVQEMNIFELIGFLSVPENGVPNSFNAPFTFKPRNIVFTKSYVSYSFPNPLAFAYSICFGVYYK